MAKLQVGVHHQQSESNLNPKAPSFRPYHQAPPTNFLDFYQYYPCPYTFQIISFCLPHAHQDQPDPTVKVVPEDHDHDKRPRVSKCKNSVSAGPRISKRGTSTTIGLRRFEAVSRRNHSHYSHGDDRNKNITNVTTLMIRNIPNRYTYV